MFLVTIHSLDDNADVQVTFDSKVLADRFAEMVEEELFSAGAYTAKVEELGAVVQLDSEVTKLYDELFAPVGRDGETILTLEQSKMDCTCSHPRSSHEDTTEDFNGYMTNETCMGHCGECDCERFEDFEAWAKEHPPVID